MDTIAWISFSLNLLSIVSILVGLWIAGRIIPSLAAGVLSENDASIFDRPLARTILWIALGGLFSLPLLDLINRTGNLVNVIMLPETAGRVTTFLGQVSAQVYSLFAPILLVIIYGAVIWAGKGFLSKPGQINLTGRIFIVLSAASLVYRAIYTIFIQVFSFQIPNLVMQQDYGQTGFLYEVLIGLALAGLILVGLNRLVAPQGGPSKKVE